MATGTTVLIVDGHAGVREGLTRRLRRVPTIGAVAAAQDLDQAACLARERAPDVVLYDPHTAPGDLPTVLGRLSVRGQQVVVLTTSLAEGEEERWRRAGAAAVVLKGCDLTTLLDCVGAALVTP